MQPEAQLLVRCDYDGPVALSLKNQVLLMAPLIKRCFQLLLFIYPITFSLKFHLQAKHAADAGRVSNLAGHAGQFPLRASTVTRILTA